MGKLDQKLLCFLVLLSAAYGWADNKKRVPRLVYHIKSQSVHAPSPIMLPKGSVSQPPILSPKLEDLPPATQAVIPSIKPPSPLQHASLEPVWSRTLSPSVESQAPNVAVGTTHDLPPIASPAEKMPIGQIHGKPPVGDESPLPLPHVPGPAISPAGIASPVIHPKNYGMPVAAPPKEISSSSSLANNSHAKGYSPVMSPAPHEVQQSSNVTRSPSASQPIPAWSPRVESPAPHEVEHSNISPAPSVSHPNPLGAAPAISPVPHEVKSPSKTTLAPSPSLPEPLKISPMISPVPHEVNRPSPITHAPLASHPPPEESSPMLSPTPHEVRKHSNVTHTPVSSQSPSSGISPTISPAPHVAEKPSNITHAPLSSHPHPAGSSPGISPVPDEAGKPSNITHAPLSSHPRPSEISPVISPRPHKEEPPSNSTHAPLSAHSHGSGSSPVLSPLPHEGKNPSNDTLAPLPARPHVSASSPTVSPLPHEVKKPSNLTHAPLASHPHPPTARVIQSPAIAPIVSPPLSARKRIGNAASAPSSSFPPSSYHPGAVISPSPQPATERPKSRQNHHTPPPHIQGLSPSPSQSNTHPPAVSPIIKGGHRATPPYTQAPSLSPIAPFPSTDTEVAPAPSKSSTGPSRHSKGPVYAPIVSPSGSFSRKPRAPSPPPLWVFPPPPPNLDCNTLSCSEPWTNPLPGTPCVCVLPIKVGLRLSVALYTFFPLVSELAQEIASGIFMKQSQVRIMGANAASEDPEKTVVLIDLVPFGKSFDRTTPFITYDKFWHKQVAIKASYFGDYDVLYVTYPGLPASPPAPADINVNDGAYGNNNNARTVRPLGVDVRKRRESLSGSLIAIIVLSSVIALVSSVGAAWFLLLKRRDHNRLSAPTSQSLLPQFLKASVAGTGPTISGSGPSSASASFSSSMAPYTGSAKSFTLAEIERATGRLDDSRIIGEGGFGRVYQGTLEDGTRVAVKVLKRDDQQGGREFLAEVEMLSRLHHRNLVKLIGICTEEHIRCLVYELIPNGSVESHLHGVDKEISPLDWNARMKIALGAARGLAYLHEDSSPPVIHRDFKSSNILLEHDYTPKVSDFGLARTALEEGNEHISTRVMGTFGYVAPEYAMTGHLLVKSDVYSYGVVLLELLTGRKPVDMSQPPGQENLVNWAHPLLTSMDGLETIIDPSLGTDIPFDSVAKVAAIASMCVQPEVSHRPFMGEVVQALKLVCSENEEFKRSESCSQDESSTKDEDARIRGFGLAEERVLPESDVFYTSARFTRDASGSFRRHSSSGPLRTGRSHQIWQRLRGFSSGSMSDHGALRLGAGLESGGQWP